MCIRDRREGALNENRAEHIRNAALQGGKNNMTKRLWLSAASAGAAVLMLLTGAGCGTGAGGGASSTAATTEKNAAESTSVGSKETGGELAATDGTLRCV